MGDESDDEILGDELAAVKDIVMKDQTDIIKQITNNKKNLKDSEITEILREGINSGGSNCSEQNVNTTTSSEENDTTTTITQDTHNPTTNTPTTITTNQASFQTSTPMIKDN